MMHASIRSTGQSCRLMFKRDEIPVSYTVPAGGTVEVEVDEVSTSQVLALARRGEIVVSSTATVRRKGPRDQANGKS